MVNDKLGKIEETTNSFRSTFNENLQATSDVQFFQGECVLSRCFHDVSSDAQKVAAILEYHYMHQSPKSSCNLTRFATCTAGPQSFTAVLEAPLKAGIWSPEKMQEIFVGQHLWNIMNYT